MHKVIISILHYNNKSDTVECLKSLADGSFHGIDVETYVLDNGSDEPFHVNTDDYKNISLTVIRNNTNTGFTGGHNLIYEKVQDMDFDFLLLLNNDCIVSKDFLKELIGGFEEPKTGACVPKIYFTKGREYHKENYKENEKGRVLWYAGGKLDWDNIMSKHIGVDEVDEGQYDQAKSIDFASGACLLLKKDVIRETGLFDEKYFLYFEDADLSKRIIKHGFKIFYVPKSVVWHNNAGSSSSGSSLHDYYLTRNRMLFGMKYAPIKSKIALLRESFRLGLSGRKWQKKGISDYYLQKFGKGSFANET